MRLPLRVPFAGRALRQLGACLLAQVLLVAAAGALPLAGDETTLDVTDDVGGLGITLVPGQSATGLLPDEVVLLPIIGGDLSIPLLEGTVEHGGTLAFEQGGIRVALEDLVFDLTNSVVTGFLGFLVDREPQFVGQVTLFGLRSCLLSTGSDPCRDDDGSTLLNGFGLDYSDTLAMFLNDAFGGGFASGDQFGVALLDVRFEEVPEPALLGWLAVAVVGTLAVRRRVR